MLILLKVTNVAVKVNITVEIDHGDEIDSYLRIRSEEKRLNEKQVKCKENLKEECKLH